MKRIIINSLLALSLFVVSTSCTDSKSGNTVIDEPESSRTAIDISFPFAWSLASVPADPELFPEASLTNDVAYGKNRALLAWYTIDRLFTQRNSPDAPGYINNDMDALSYPYARDVVFSEVFPGREPGNGESSVIETLNLSFYPRERGPYNLDGSNVDQDGYLLYPERLNLGEVSEDVLKDGLLSYENGLTYNGDNTYVTHTVWGKVPSQAPLMYAFDNSNGSRILQDVGLDGLTDQAEFEHPTYAKFLNELRSVLPESKIIAMLDDPFSPFNDPACDNYAYYLNNYYDYQRFAINGRYKHYNGTEGNSLSQSDAGDSQYQTSRSTPNAEDINLDLTLNEDERFFQYRIAIRPDFLQVGKNFITDKRVAKVHVCNGQTQEATWYQFTIPLNQYQKKVGSIQDFSNIRYVRMFMTGFKGITHLRFATLELAGDE